MFDRIAQQYRGTTAVVVGAGGIGAEMIRLLTGSVKHLVVADQSDSLHTRFQHSSISASQLDVRDSQSVGDFFKSVHATVGAPDFLFYTAGILSIKSFVDTSPDHWQRAVDVNLNGAFYCVKAASEWMIPQRRGSMLLLGSIAGTKARSGTRVNPVYNATKAGLAALVNATAMQLRPHGIRINCISPGPTATSMMDLQPDHVRSAVADIMLDHRMNLAAEVAELALFIAAHGRFTGEDIAMGGGAGLGG